VAWPGIMRAQDNYEIQVYPSETMTPKTLLVELHSNLTVEGSTTTPSGKHRCTGKPELVFSIFREGPVFRGSNQFLLVTGNPALRKDSATFMDSVRFKPWKPRRRSRLSSVASASKHKQSAATIVLCLQLIVATTLASGVDNRAVEHPGSVHADDDCSSCHRDKARGKSVHSAMELSCTVCHLARTQGDMTTLTLLMPKPKICDACHEETSSLREHRPVAKGQA